MTLAEYRAWLDGMIAATGDERLKLAREKLVDVVEAAPVFLPPISPAPFTSPSIPPYPWPVACTTGSITGASDPNIRCWNGAMQ